MSEFSATGIDALAADLKKLGNDIENIEEEMLDAGAEVYVDEWKKGIEAAGHVDTGDMRDSVTAAPGKKNKKSREILPRGKDRKGTENNMKAFRTHYGTQSKPGDRFVDKIEDAAEPKATAAMQDILNAHLKKKGLI